MTEKATEKATEKKLDENRDRKPGALNGREADHDMQTQRPANRPGENGPRLQQSDPHNQ